MKRLSSQKHSFIDCFRDKCAEAHSYKHTIQNIQKHSSKSTSTFKKKKIGTNVFLTLD